MRSSRRTRIRSAAAAIAAGAGLLLSGCAAGGASEPANTVSYWLWDSNQMPAYQKCAAGFEKENPGLTVKITQLGWNDYWTKLQTGIVRWQPRPICAQCVASVLSVVFSSRTLPPAAMRFSASAA